MNPDKPSIPEKDNNKTDLKTLNSKKYFTKALLELGAQGFSEEEVSSCANIITEVDKLIVGYKQIQTYIEGNTVNIKFNTGHPDRVGKGRSSSI